MKIRFFGDSWYWGWMFEIPKSKTLKKIEETPPGAIPFFKVYLESVGIECVSHNCPGSSFFDTTDSIIKTTDHKDIKYNVVFFSSLMRRHHEQWKDQFDFSNYDIFISQYNSKVLDLLKKIQKWAEIHDQQVLLIGGQSTLYKYLFDRLEDNKNLHLIVQCAISKILKNADPVFGAFKLSTDMAEHIKMTWNTKIIEHIYRDIKNFQQDTSIKFVTWPDAGHLNAAGIFLLTDIILKKIEELEELEELTNDTYENIITKRTLL